MRKGLDHVDFKPRVRQSVPTVEGETPAAVVMVLVGRWVDQSGGSVVVVSLMIFAILSSLRVRGTGRSWCIIEGSHPIEGESPYSL